MTIPAEELAYQIFAQFDRSRIVQITPIIGLGSVNTVVLVETKNEKFIVRVNLKKEIARFNKEKWCIQQALRLAIPSPSVLDIGIYSGYAYMLQTFIEGENGTTFGGDKNAIWAQLGQYAQRYHSVATVGFGEDLIDERQGQFDGSWHTFIQYNINSLNPDDHLLELDVLTPPTSARVRQRFEQLLQMPFTFGLNHCDLAERNTIINGNGKVFLLDWGCAGAHIIPHFELNEIVRLGISPESSEFLAFLQGYGLSETSFEAMKPVLHDLALLQAIDKLRWAIDRHPAKIVEFSKRAKLMASRV